VCSRLRGATSRTPKAGCLAGYRGSCRGDRQRPCWRARFVACCRGSPRLRPACRACADAVGNHGRGIEQPQHAPEIPTIHEERAGREHRIRRTTGPSPSRASRCSRAAGSRFPARPTTRGPGRWALSIAPRDGGFRIVLASGVVITDFDGDLARVPVLRVDGGRRPSGPHRSARPTRPVRPHGLEVIVLGGQATLHGDRFGQGATALRFGAVGIGIMPGNARRASSRAKGRSGERDASRGRYGELHDDPLIGKRPPPPRRFPGCNPHPATSRHPWCAPRPRHSPTRQRIEMRPHREGRHGAGHERAAAQAPDQQTERAGRRQPHHAADVPPRHFVGAAGITFPIVEQVPQVLHVAGGEAGDGDCRSELCLAPVNVRGSQWPHGAASMSVATCLKGNVRSRRRHLGAAIRLHAMYEAVRRDRQVAQIRPAEPARCRSSPVRCW